LFWQFERDVLDGSIVARSDHNLEAGECTVKRLVRDITVTDVNLVLSTGQFASVGRKNFSTVHNDGGNDITDRVVFPVPGGPLTAKIPSVLDSCFHSTLIATVDSKPEDIQTASSLLGNFVGPRDRALAFGLDEYRPCCDD
jgi:hypothetical protein